MGKIIIEFEGELTCSNCPLCKPSIADCGEYEGECCDFNSSNDELEVEACFLGDIRSKYCTLKVED